jgi:hypothetical protein
MFPICITDVGLEGKDNDVGDGHFGDSGLGYSPDSDGMHDTRDGCRISDKTGHGTYTRTCIRHSAWFRPVNHDSTTYDSYALFGRIDLQTEHPAFQAVD